MKGTVFNIQRFSLHDGPGIRTTVFLKGCPLRCVWCHNPESQAVKPQLSFFAGRCIACGGCFSVCNCHQPEDGTHRIDFTACRACGRCAEACPSAALEIIGREVSVQEILSEAERDIPFYGTSGGGLTLSGGEPTAQPDFAAELLAMAKARGIHTAMETSGFASWETFSRLIPDLDLILYDVKQMDAALHRRYTGVDNRLILSNLEKLSRADIHTRVVVRTPVIPGYNDQAENFRALADFLLHSELIPDIEVLPYNSLAGSKYPRMGMTFLPGPVKETDGNAPDELCRILTDSGLSARVMR